MSLQSFNFRLFSCLNDFPPFFFFLLCAYALGWMRRALLVCDQCLSISSLCVWASLYACACMIMCVHLHLRVFVVWNQRRISVSLWTLIKMFWQSVIIWPYGQHNPPPPSYTHVLSVSKVWQPFHNVTPTEQPERNKILILLILCEKTVFFKFEFSKERRGKKTLYLVRVWFLSFPSWCDLSSVVRAPWSVKCGSNHCGDGTEALLPRGAADAAQIRKKGQLHGSCSQQWFGLS